MGAARPMRTPRVMGMTTNMGTRKPLSPPLHDSPCQQAS